MNAPAMPGGNRTDTVLAVAVVAVLVLLVAVGFLFDLPFGFGGWELAIVAAPVALAVGALSWVLRTGRRR